MIENVWMSMNVLNIQDYASIDVSIIGDCTSKIFN